MFRNCNCVIDCQVCCLEEIKETKMYELISNYHEFRFRETLVHLKECLKHMDDDLGEDEIMARVDLVEVCRDIIGHSDFMEE